MPNDTYQPPRQPPTPPLAGLLDGPGARETFNTADRRERTDPYGLSRQERPDWLDPTPVPVVRHLRAGTVGSELREHRPREAPAPPVWPWVLGGLVLGTMVTMVTIGWLSLVLHVDDEGLLPLPQASAQGLVTR
ncbi:MAG: hypothetical protein AAGA48_23005 [Myxococcota bacterium]